MSKYEILKQQPDPIPTRPAEPSQAVAARDDEGDGRLAPALKVPPPQITADELAQQIRRQNTLRRARSRGLDL